MKRSLTKQDDGRRKGLASPTIARLQSSVPSDLRESPGWLCWKFEGTDNPKPRKVPINAETGHRANVTDPAECSRLEQAIAGCARWDTVGVGFAPIPFDHLVGLDFDNCRDAATGVIDAWAQQYIDDLNSYTEVTPSGTGVRIWVSGQWPYDTHRIDGFGEKGIGRIEIYSHSRFFTVTGDHVAGTPSTIERCQAKLDTLYKQLWPAADEQRPLKTTGPSKALEDDATIIKRARSGKNGDKFRRLWDGKWQRDYPSQSEADIALCGQLAFFTGCETERMDKLFRKSGLYRESKWDEQHFSNGETYGQHTVRVAIENAQSTIRTDVPAEKASTDATICVADVQSRDLTWLWKNFIPKGKLTLLVGDPGNGKSLMTLSLAASVTSGLPMPDGAECERGSVLLLNAEDAVEDTVRPRLEAAGADLKLCRFFPFMSGTGQITVQIPNKLGELKNAINRYKPALVVIDPLAPFLASKIDTFKDQSVRSALAQLNELAEKTGTAIVLVVHLNKKEDGKKMLYRPGASIAFVAASRSVLLAEREKDDEYTLSVLKANLAARQNPFTYKIAGPDDEAPHIVWGGQRAASTSGNQVDSSPISTNSLSDAKEFLLELLEQGPQTTSSVIADARQAGLAVITLRRAKSALKIESVRVRFGPNGYWAWQLPAPVEE